MDRTLFYSNMTVSLCIRQESKRNDDSVSVEELDWSAESSWTPLVWLYMSQKLITKHQWLVHMGAFISYTSELCNRGGNTFFKYIHSFVAPVWKCLFSSKGANTFVHIMNAQVIGVWWCIFVYLSPCCLVPVIFVWHWQALDHSAIWTSSFSSIVSDLWFAFLSFFRRRSALRPCPSGRFCLTTREYVWKMCKWTLFLSRFSFAFLTHARHLIDSIMS